jgi:hypothetical protein
MRNGSLFVISTGSRPGRHTAQRPEGCRRRTPSLSVMESDLLYKVSPSPNRHATSAMGARTVLASTRPARLMYHGEPSKLLRCQPYLVILFRCCSAPNDMQGSVLDRALGPLGRELVVAVHVRAQLFVTHPRKVASISSLNLLHVEAPELPAQLFCPDRRARLSRWSALSRSISMCASKVSAAAVTLRTEPPTQRQNRSHVKVISTRLLQLSTRGSGPNGCIYG